MLDLKEVFLDQLDVPDADTIRKRIVDDWLPIDGERAPSAVRPSGELAEGGFNLIPSEGGDECRPLVVALCTSSRQFHERLRELVYHLGILCREKTTSALFVTRAWDEKQWSKHTDALERLVRDGKTIYVADIQNGQHRLRHARAMP